MNEIVKKLEKKIIVSCQAAKGEPFNDIACLTAMIKSVVNGGAAGLRLAGEESIKAAREFTDIPIIGITKPEPLPDNWKEVVYITPTCMDAELVANAGADIIAIDGTSRLRPKENLAGQIEYIKHNLNKLVMVDIATVEEGLMCALLGVDIISTTLSGYTAETLEKNPDEPDFELLARLVKAVNKPIILEGRIWEPAHVKKAFELGAFAVVIGSAITRPHLITRRFVDSY